MDNIAIRNERIIETACEKGRETAETYILVHPLPWSRNFFVKMTDKMMENWLTVLATLCENDEEMQDLVCEVIASARQGFVERIVELMGAGASFTAGRPAQC